jgi:nucleotide-binding universal stress UspA family protein
MFENILVAVDRSKHSDAAFDVAMDIAQKYSSQLFVLHVFQGGTGSGTLASLGFEDDMRAIGQQIFDSMKQRARKDIIVFEMSKCFCRRAMQQRGLWKLQVR